MNSFIRNDDIWGFSEVFRTHVEFGQTETQLGTAWHRMLARAISLPRATLGSLLKPPPVLYMLAKYSADKNASFMLLH